MKNRHVRDKLSVYIDGRLSEKEVSAVKDHLDLCPECRKDYEEMVKIIGHMNQMERLETPDAFVEKVHTRIDKRSSLQRLVKGLFYPLKIKVPLELAGVAAAALLVIYIVGIRGKQHIYELAYVQRYQIPDVLQEQTVETGIEVEEAISIPDEAAPQRKKADPEFKQEEEKGGKRDKRSELKVAVTKDKTQTVAFAPTEKGTEKQVQLEDAIQSSKMVEEDVEPESEPQEEEVERKARISADAPRIAKAPSAFGDQKKEAPRVIKAQGREKRGLEITDKEKGVTEKELFEAPPPIEKSLEEILVALGGEIVESEYNKDTQLLESLVIEIPAERFQKLIQALEGRGDIQEPYPVIQEKGKDTIRVRIRVRKML
ncbi:MAG: zf-HC2 domain-containing protein [Candidatus Aminicenantes bacterium]|jgi:hypothetical protein